MRAQGSANDMTTAKPTLIRRIAIDVLARAEKYQSFVNTLIDDRFKRYRNLTPREKAIATEVIYGTLRNQRLLDVLISRFSKVKPTKMERRTLLALRTGMYQVLFMRKIPHALAVNESVKLVKPQSRALTNAVLRTACRAKGRIEEIVDEKLDGFGPAERLAMKYSHPDWIVQRWVNRFGAEFTERWLQANNTPAPLFVRVNTLKSTTDELAQKLNEMGLDAKPCDLVPDCLTIEGASISSGLAWIKQGLGTIQDAASQLAGLFVEPRPDELILDACAAPGTKATHIAQLARNEAMVVALDISKAKLELLREAMLRLGTDSIAPVRSDILAGIPLGSRSFDKVTVDAPCANLGLLRRHPELRWKREPKDVVEMAELQLRMLNAVSGLPKPNGLLIYSVCSISEEENEDVIARFLADNPQYEVAEPPKVVKSVKPSVVCDDKAARTFCHIHNSDGFFIIRMRRKP